MSYDDIRPIFKAKFNSNIAFLLKTKEQLEEKENKAIQSINETPAQKAAKRRKLNEEAKDLKKHLEIVPNEDDDVYKQATPLARKVPVVDYKIIHLNNKPHYKIIRADGTHQLYVSFLTMLKNFDREDLESLWSLVKERFSTSKPNNFFDDFLLTTLGAIEDLESLWSLVKERFSTSKPNNFSDDFLLTTLGAMFERPNGQSQVWKNQRTVHGDTHSRGLPVRLKVEEQSKMSLELLSFGVDAAMDLEEKTKCLMLLVKNLVLPSKVTAVGLVLLKEELMLLSQVNTANVILMLSRQS
nr:hypothetical protein [Tanacetum cinerariifolium]